MLGAGETIRITKLETVLVQPRWLFLKVHTDVGIVGLGEPVVEGRARTVAEAVRNGEDETRQALIFADVADNPGGGGGGNTTWILSALHDAGAYGVLLGVFFDPALAREAHKRGEGASFDATFNAADETEYSKKFEEIFK